MMNFRRKLFIYLNHGVAVDFQFGLKVALLQENLSVINVHVYAVLCWCSSDP